jgi:hypothetical protein
MNTLVIVLSAVLGQTGDAPMLGQKDYAQAQKMAAQNNKPMAVFLNQGKTGDNKLITDGLSDRAKEILAKNYIAVMVDTTTPEGRDLAKAFEIRNGQGLILSDRGGAMQALWYQGTLTNQDLIRNLEKYTNLTNVRMTEVAGRASMYPPADESGNATSTVNRQGNSSNPPTTSSNSSGQRRLLFRNSNERGRIFQGRLGLRSQS